MKVRRANSALSVARNVGGEDKNYTEPSYGNPERRNKVSMSSQIPTSFPYTDIVEGIRSPMHGPKGLCEEASEEFICVAGKGDCVRVTELLEEGLVHVDVADKTGFTSLLAASVSILIGERKEPGGYKVNV